MESIKWLATTNFLDNLIVTTNGNLYGTTAGGGTSNDGTFFSITLAGAETVLHSFANATGNLGFNTNSGVILGFDGNFYGVSAQSGPAPAPSPVAPSSSLLQQVY